MTSPRNSIVIPGENIAYHCTARCVRRAYLYGRDAVTGKSYKHRRVWVRNRIRLLSSVFTIDIASYAVMDNHLHIVIIPRHDKAAKMGDEDVVDRWLTLYPPKDQETRDQKRKMMLLDQERIAILRERMASLSWFMKSLAEYLARLANEEDGVTGRFWEGRFTSKRLEDASALVVAMVYVDLNPIRAGMATTPEDSDDTSVQDRIRNRQDGPILLDLGIDIFEELSLEEYLELVDSTGREIVSGKRGAIPASLTPILNRLKINNKVWLDTASNFGRKFCNVAGPIDIVRERAKAMKVRCYKGISACKETFLGLKRPIEPAKC